MEIMVKNVGMIIVKESFKLIDKIKYIFTLLFTNQIHLNIFYLIYKIKTIKLINNRK